jgi:hypothetical protein
MSSSKFVCVGRCFDSLEMISVMFSIPWDIDLVLLRFVIVAGFDEGSIPKLRVTSDIASLYPAIALIHSSLFQCVTTRPFSVLSATIVQAGSEKGVGEEREKSGREERRKRGGEKSGREERGRRAGESIFTHSCSNGREV